MTKPHATFALERASCPPSLPRPLADQIDACTAAVKNAVDAARAKDADRRSIKNLMRYLHQVHGTRPIVLIDEYDAKKVASSAKKAVTKTRR